MNGTSMQHISRLTFCSLRSGKTTWPTSGFDREVQHLIYYLDMLCGIQFWESINNLLKLCSSLKVKLGYFGLLALFYYFHFAAKNQ